MTDRPRVTIRSLRDDTPVSEHTGRLDTRTHTLHLDDGRTLPLGTVRGSVDASSWPVTYRTATGLVCEIHLTRSEEGV
jgi:hypothetical protein